MRRLIGNHLIKLAYTICPELKAELASYFEATIEWAAHQTASQLLAHQQATARIASRQ